MPRFKLTIEYAGTRYSGWQIQKNARTIQGEIDKAVRAVTRRHDFELYGSGRTDAGVHAVAQVAHLDLATPLDAETLRRRLNEELPADIDIVEALVVRHRFHARHSAVGRRYIYQLSRRRTAFAKPYVWWVKEPLDLERMRDSAAVFLGRHDFSSFAEVSGREDPAESERSTLVQIDRLEIVEDGALVLVVIEGSHFLWKMVRRIVGVLVEIGRGGLTPEAASACLRAPSTAPARLTAPASGLFLAGVYYDNEPRSPASAITPVSRSPTA